MPTIRKKAGRISPVLMGDYDDTTTYRRLDWVYYGGTSYICKKNNTLNVTPTNTEKWQKIIELPTELNMIFTEAVTRENISSGEKLSVILGKIKKCISDIKDVAFSGSYNDLSDTPNSLKNPNSLNIKFNGTSQASYDGSVQKEVDVTPAGIGAVNTSTLLNTTEQISANTDVNNITGALAAKAMMADYNNKINTINSNLDKKVQVVAYGSGTGLESKTLDIPTDAFGLYLVIAWSRYINSYTICLLVDSEGYRRLYNVVGENAINISYDDNNRKLLMQRGEGDAWAYGVIGLTPWTPNTFN